MSGVSPEWVEMRPEDELGGLIEEEQNLMSRLQEIRSRKMQLTVPNIKREEDESGGKKTQRRKTRKKGGKRVKAKRV